VRHRTGIKKPHVAEEKPDLASKIDMEKKGPKESNDGIQLTKKAPAA
jgi:hypothetical protein